MEYVTEAKRPVFEAIDSHILEGTGRSGWVAPVMLAFAVPWGIWTFTALLGSGGSELAAFNVAAGWFVILAIGYLGLHGRRGLALCSLPVLLTIRALIEFIAIPTWRFAVGDDGVDTVYVKAMFLVLIGLAAFWTGSLIFMNEAKVHFVPSSRDTPSRITFICAVMMILGFGGKLVMWKLHLLSYTADYGFREDKLAIMQWLNLLANLLNVALVVSAIEVLGKQNREALIRFVFMASVAGSIVFGVISGMKSECLKPFICLVLVYVLTRGRVPRTAYLIPVLLILMYPFVNAYRDNLNSGYRDQSNTIEGLAAVLEKSFVDVIQTHDTGIEKASMGFDLTANRLSLLTGVRDVIGLPEPSLLNGDEKIWFAPFYPLIPRLLWEGKPVLNKGQRLSVATGHPSTNSSAVTPIGDLYSMYGIYGMIVGMLIYGFALQIYTNKVTAKRLSEKSVFIYILMLMALTNLEVDAVSLVASSVQIGLILLVTSYFIYGSSTARGYVRRYRKELTAV